MIRNVVLDMGMVLMDYHPLQACRALAPHEAAAQQLYAALFAHPEWIGLDDNTLSLPELTRRATARVADPALRPLIQTLTDGLPYNVLTPIPGMEDTVNWIRSLGFRTYVLSNAGLNVSQHPEIIPGIERFDGVLFSADEGVIKPDPRIYRRLTQRFSLTPAECFFVDDNAANAQGARDEGWQAYVHTGDIPALRARIAALPRA